MPMDRVVDTKFKFQHGDIVKCYIKHTKVKFAKDGERIKEDIDRGVQQGTIFSCVRMNDKYNQYHIKLDKGGQAVKAENDITPVRKAGRPAKDV